MIDIVTSFYILIPLFWLPVLLIGTDIEGKWELKVLLQGHLISALVISFLVLLIGFKIISDPLDMALSHRLGIPFERSTYPIRSTSIYFVYMVPATIYAFGQMLGDNHRKLYSVLFVTLFATCFLTAFRKVWLGVFFGIIFYALFYEKTRGVMSRMLALLSPLLVFSLYLIHSVAPESTAARIEAYESTIRFVMNNPLGVGHGGVEQITGWTAHNILLDAFSKYGIGAFALLLTICIISVLQAVRVGKHSSNIVIMSLAASIIALLIGLQFENSYTMQRFWLILGLFYASIDIDVASDSNDIA